MAYEEYNVKLGDRWYKDSDLWKMLDVRNASHVSDEEKNTEV